MAATLRIEPDAALVKELIELGGDFKVCQHCATCTATCSLSTGDHPFPRRQMLLAQWGLKEELMADPAPWLCFYCGECSKACTRKANPGETMMALRRYLTTMYDWTGLSRLMYRSMAWEIGVLAIVAMAVIALFTLPSSFGFGLLSRHPDALNTVMLDRFAPKEVVHLGDTIMALVLSFFLLTNAWRMFSALTSRSNIPFSEYLKRLPFLVVHGVTQKRWGDCADKDGVRNWLRHLALVSGYGLIFTLVVIFLPWFQIENHSFHWTSILGYYSTIALLVTTGWMIADRLRKRTEMHRFSHLSDWLFPILLFLTALSGILVNVFRLMDMPMPTYVIYTAHLAIAVPMLVVEVPFGKWAHLLYRPLALWVAAVQKEEATAKKAMSAA